MQDILVVSAILTPERPDIPELTRPWVLDRVVPYGDERGTFLISWIVPEDYDVDSFCDAFVKLHALGYQPDFTYYTNSDICTPFELRDGIKSRLPVGLKMNLCELRSGEAL